LSTPEIDASSVATVAADRRTAVAIRAYRSRHSSRPFNQKLPENSMRYALVTSPLLLAVLLLAVFIPNLGNAQSQSPQLPLPPGGFKPPPLPPIKPYKPLTITPPESYSDPSFAAFRKQLGGVADRKDRAALAKLVVAQGFFWKQDKDLADKSKSGVDNLAKAIDLDSKDGSGWDTLASYADESTAQPLPDQQGVICAPANPTIDPKAFEALLQATQTEPQDWGYPNTAGVEMRSAPQPNGPVVEKLGLTLVRVLPDSAPPTEPNQPAFLHLAAPSGKTGYAAMDVISGLGGDEICYTKDAGGWKIYGYFGGTAQ
jgi:hypothetical protein